MKAPKGWALQEDMPRGTQGPLTQEGQWRMKPLRRDTKGLSTWALSFLSQMCVVVGVFPNFQDGGMMF